MKNSKLQTIHFLALSLAILLYLYMGAINAAEDNEAAFSATKVSTEAPEKKMKALPHFTTIDLSGLGNLIIKQTNKEANFTVEAETAILPLVVVYVKNDVLYIDLKNASEHTEAKINFYLSVKELKTITSSSSSTITIEGFKADELTVNLVSFGEGKINVDVNKLNVKLEGGSRMTASGNAEQQMITINGAGEFHGARLAGKNVSLELSGTSLATVAASDNLTVKISGEGKVHYCGRPSITKDISGKGSIVAAEDTECSKN
jgi:hypothetical protein